MQSTQNCFIVYNIQLIMIYSVQSLCLNFFHPFPIRLFLFIYLVFHIFENLVWNPTMLVGMTKLFRTSSYHEAMIIPCSSHHIYRHWDIPQSLTHPFIELESSTTGTGWLYSYSPHTQWSFVNGDCIEMVKSLLYG